MKEPNSEGPMQRVRELLQVYGSDQSSAATLLCDQRDPDQIAYRIVAADLSDRPLSYGELRSESERVAAGLAALGIVPGDRVATLMGKSRAYLVTLMAIWRLGAVHVPLFTAFAPAAIALRLQASAAALVVCDAAQRSKLEPGGPMPVEPSWRVATSGPVGPGDVAFEDLLHSSGAPPVAAAMGGDAPIIQIYTSGTTGAPKGVLVPLRAVAAFQIYAEYGLGLGAEDCFWNAADPGWAYGLYFGVLGALSTGVEGLLFEGGFSPEATLQILEKFQVTNFTAAPTVYRALRGSGLGLSERPALRCASSAGEPLTPEVNDWAVSALGLQVHDHYGQTEAGMLINNHQHPDFQRPLRPGSMGRPMPGWSAAVLKIDKDELAPVGQLGRVAFDLAASPLAWFKGYVEDPLKSAEKFTSDGRWYLSGDIGRTDEEGYFHFASRDDDVIIMAGYRIGPFEVESVILTHPAVSECAVIARPDAVRGEVLEAVVVLADGWRPSENLTRELQDQVKKGFAAHAYPRRIHYFEALPKTPSGKVQRFVVREQLQALGALGEAG